jgi:hypothetical protein
MIISFTFFCVGSEGTEEYVGGIFLKTPVPESSDRKYDFQPTV